MPRCRGRDLLVGCAVGTLVTLVGCGGGDDVSEADRARLEASLSFLGAQYQFSADQVGCVREQLERRVPADELGQLDQELQGVDAGVVALDDLPAGQAEAVTASIATCAVAG